jgi:hypothetical protein
VRFDTEVLLTLQEACIYDPPMQMISLIQVVRVPVLQSGFVLDIVGNNQ